MWAYNETFYQIYPIGFCGAPVHNDGVTVPRIKKIGEWSEYLETLGIGSIILNPIFNQNKINNLNLVKFLNYLIEKFSNFITSQSSF